MYVAVIVVVVVLSRREILRGVAEMCCVCMGRELIFVERWGTGLGRG